MSNPNRIAKGVSAGGQFAAGSRPEDAGVALGTKPAEPETLSSMMLAGHKTYVGAGFSSDKAIGALVGTAAGQLEKRYYANLNSAAQQGSGELTLAYLASHKAVSRVLKSAVENIDDSEALRQDVNQARRGLHDGPAGMFRSFGPNNITAITTDTDRFLGEIETFMDEVNPE